jgi:hypothetical protein
VRARQRRLEATQAADKAIDTQYAYLFVAGLFNEFYPGYLRETVTHFSAAGVRSSSCQALIPLERWRWPGSHNQLPPPREDDLATEAESLGFLATPLGTRSYWWGGMGTQAVAVLSGARGDALVRDNAVRILAEVETLASRTGKRVVLVGHSKGGLDCAAALALFEHRLAPHVRGLVTVQSPYGGSPIAADLLAEPTLAKAVEVILEKLVGAPAGEHHLPSSPVCSPHAHTHTPTHSPLNPTLCARTRTDGPQA